MDRRHFLHAASAALASAPLTRADDDDALKRRMKFGLVTYMWGADWDLPTLIANCEKAGLLGVELRTEHKHGVEPSLTADQRREVKKRFADSRVICIGPGTNQEFDSPDPARLRQQIEGTKAFLQLSHDIGGSGVKVKPNRFHKEVAKARTLVQIGESLRGLGQFAADLGQQIRVEVHGDPAPLFYMQQIMEVADHPNVKVCWNSNDEDLHWKGGIEQSFQAVQPWIGQTTHVRELNLGDYPYQKLIDLLSAMKYDGWVLLEARTKPEDRIRALQEQREVFESMVKKASTPG